MRVMRRLATALVASAVIIVLVGCGGLGINIGSGTSRGSNLVDVVSIQVQSGPNVPQVVRGHQLVLQGIAYYFFGGTQYVSATQGAIWTTAVLPSCDGALVACGDIIRFMDPQCLTELSNTVGTSPNQFWTTVVPSQTVCILGVAPGTATLFATVKGVTGQITVTVL